MIIMSEDSSLHWKEIRLRQLKHGSSEQAQKSIHLGCRLWRATGRLCITSSILWHSTNIKPEHSLLLCHCNCRLQLMLNQRVNCIALGFSGWNKGGNTIWPVPTKPQLHWQYSHFQLLVPEGHNCRHKKCQHYSSSAFQIKEISSGMFSV
jgi:hypothetical protein